ncbi:plasmid replication initiation protein, partial [Cronobacter sakazakii]
MHRRSEKMARQKKRPRRCRSSIGSAPLTSITESVAQISGGAARQDYNVPWRFPQEAHPSALLFLPFGLLVSFRCYRR